MARLTTRRVAAAEQRLGPVPDAALQAEVVRIIGGYLEAAAAEPTSVVWAHETASLIAATATRAQGLQVYGTAVARLAAEGTVDQAEVAAYRARITAQIGRFDLAPSLGG